MRAKRKREGPPSLLACHRKPNQQQKAKRHCQIALPTTRTHERKSLARGRRCRLPFASRRSRKILHLIIHHDNSNYSRRRPSARLVVLHQPEVAVRAAHVEVHRARPVAGSSKRGGGESPVIKKCATVHYARAQTHDDTPIARARAGGGTIDVLIFLFFVSGLDFKGSHARARCAPP